MKNSKLTTITAKMWKLPSGDPLSTSFFGYIDDYGNPCGLQYFLEEKAFVFTRTQKKHFTEIRSISQELSEKERNEIPKVILDGLVEVAKSQKIMALEKWFMDKK